MLVYNFQKEFVGIDKQDLSALGYDNLAELRNEAADFADLFVKTPGFVHNFKHVHWIDFITCSDAHDDSKVIIHAKNKNFKCSIDIKPMYLVDNPNAQGFIITLQNLRALTHEENEKIAGDLLERPAPKPASETTALFNTPEMAGEFESDFEEEATAQDEFDGDPYANDIELEVDESDFNSNIVEDIYEAPEEQTPTIEDDVISVDDDLYADEAPQEVEVTPEDSSAEVVAATAAVATGVAAATTQTAPTSEDTEFDNSYVYDPHVASSELGLPVDLIEEFIQDFISQADEFKDDLYNSLEMGDIDNVKILSHKLKGVAANLRIEDAFEVLRIINTSDEVAEIKLNLDRLYRIVAKLAGEEEAPVVAPPVDVADEEPAQEETEVAPLEIEDETPEIAIANEEISDEEVPDKIDIPVLADDEFVHNEETQAEPEQDIEEEIAIIEDFKDDAEEEITLSTEVEIDEPLELLDDPMDEDPIEMAPLTDEPTQDESDIAPLEEEDDIEPLELADSLDIIDDPMDSDAGIETAEEQAPTKAYDKEAVANEIGLSQEKFDELFSDYLKDAQDTMENVENAILIDHTSEWARYATKLKSMSENMRLNDLENDLDTLINTKDSTSAKAALDALRSKIDTLSTEG